MTNNLNRGGLGEYQYATFSSSRFSVNTQIRA